MLLSIIFCHLCGKTIISYGISATNLAPLKNLCGGQYKHMKTSQLPKLPQTSFLLWDYQPHYCLPMSFLRLNFAYIVPIVKFFLTEPIIWLGKSKQDFLPIAPNTKQILTRSQHGLCHRLYIFAWITIFFLHYYRILPILFP